MNSKKSKLFFDSKTWWWFSLIISCFLVLLIYFNVIIGLIKDWWHDPNYSHGFLIPLISAYLIWEKRDIIKNLNFQGHFAGGILLILGGMIFIIGNIAGEQFSKRISLLFILAGLILLYGGKSLWKHTRFPICYLIFMIPLPYILYDSIAFPLKLLATKFSTAILHFLDITMYSEGNLIYLPNTTLEVADACSGIRSLISVLALSVIIAKIVLKHPLKRIILVISSVPVVLLCNMLRIIMTGILAAKYPELSKGFFHLFSGEVIFLLGIGIILLLAFFLREKDTQEDNKIERLDSKDLEYDKTPGTNKDPLIAPILLMAILAVNLFVTKVEAVPLLRPLENFPQRIDGFQQVSIQQLDDNIKKILGVDHYIWKTYAFKNGYKLMLYVGYFEDQKEGAMIHSPKHCYPGGGWHPLSAKTIKIAIPAIQKDITINEYILTKNNNKKLVYYWYQSRGRTIANEYIDRIYMILDSLLRHRSDGALVRISGPAENLEEAKRIQKKFIQEVYPILLKYLPS